jgi:hypothetical protein
MLSSFSLATAQSGLIKVTDVKMVHENELVTLSFGLRAGEKAVKPYYNLVVKPMLSNEGEEKHLPSVIVRGRGSKILDQRHELTGEERREGRVMSTNSSIKYSVKFPYESWMRGGTFYLKGVNVGCCSATEVNMGVIAEDILHADPKVETEIIGVPTLVTYSTGKQINEEYPFVSSAKDFELIQDVLEHTDDPDIIERIIAATRVGGTVSIYFGQGLRRIDRNFGKNNVNLVELISVVRSLLAAKDTKIVAIVVAGFASPEGSISFNEKLAYDRASAVKEFLISNSTVDTSVVHVFNGKADWGGLRDLVEKSNMRQKQQIIDIINTVPIWDNDKKIGRLGELMRLDRGEPYHYMLRNFFPQLRQAAYIKVYYDDGSK